MADMMAGTAILVIFSAILFGTNAFNGAIPESSYHNMMNFTLGLTLVTLVLNIIYLHGVFERITVLLVNKVETETRGHLSIFR